MYKIGDIVNCKILKVLPTFVIVETSDNFKGLVHISNISDYYLFNLKLVFDLNKKFDFKILSIDNEKKWLKLDWKSIVPRFKKDPFDFEIQETKNGFSNLNLKVQKEIEND